MSARVSVLVRDESMTGCEAGRVTLEDIPSQITMRDLIRTRVRDEVARYNARPDGRFAGLVMPEGAEIGTGGYVLTPRRRVDWERQADQAIAAFDRNGFFVLVDDRQVTELDAVLELSADSDIRFVRLVQLVGG